jgi:CheY-like chemotaxis protein
MNETCDLREILLIEDDLMDVLILRRVFQDVGVTNILTHMTNGQQALTYLKDPDRPEPCAILLDLDMPGITGTEFLELAHQEETLKDIPVIVVTASDSPDDLDQSFKLGATAYIVKSSDYDEFRRKINQLRCYFGLREHPAEGNDTTSRQETEVWASRS